MSFNQIHPVVIKGSVMAKTQSSQHSPRILLVRVVVMSSVLMFVALPLLSGCSRTVRMRNIYMYRCQDGFESRDRNPRVAYDGCAAHGGTTDLNARVTKEPELRRATSSRSIFSSKRKRR